jgi:hypothetical protein
MEPRPQEHTIDVSGRAFTFRHPAHQPGGECYRLLELIAFVGPASFPVLELLSKAPSDAPLSEVIHQEASAMRELSIETEQGTFSFMELCLHLSK